MTVDTDWGISWCHSQCPLSNEALVEQTEPVVRQRVELVVNERVPSIVECLPYHYIISKHHNLCDMSRIGGFLWHSRRIRTQSGRRLRAYPSIEIQQHKCWRGWELRYHRQTMSRPSTPQTWLYPKHSSQSIGQCRPAYQSTLCLQLRFKTLKSFRIEKPWHCNRRDRQHLHYGPPLSIYGGGALRYFSSQ